MTVTVKLFASFRTDRFDIKIDNYPDDTTVGDIVNSLGIPLKEVGIMMLNRRHTRVDQLLKDGDIIALFPLLGGG